MKILHINQQAGPGGASGICLALHQALLEAGNESFVLAGRKVSVLPSVGLVDNDCYRPAWARFWMSIANKLSHYSGRVRGADRVATQWLPRLASPQRLSAWFAGHEDFDFPGTKHLLEQAPLKPDVLQLHNLHGDYFDLRELPLLNRIYPTVISLHDAWMLSGHCSHSFDCERWKTGCGSCPRLDITPALRKDGSAFNWNRKQSIYKDSILTVVCPSHWLAEKVRKSILMPAAKKLLVIPNGVDTSVFRPGDKADARKRLGWPQEAFIVMFAANGVRRSIWKDYPTMREGIQLASDKIKGVPIRFFAIGDTSPSEKAGPVSIDFLPYRASLVECYQAADVYLHAARAESWGLVITEALACGTPVVASAVGGIPEQIVNGKTGYLVPGGDAPALAERLAYLAHNPEATRTMGAAAAHDAAERFSLRGMVGAYSNLYREMSEQKLLTHGR